PPVAEAPRGVAEFAGSWAAVRHVPSASIAATRPVAVELRTGGAVCAGAGAAVKFSTFTFEETVSAFAGMFGDVSRANEPSLALTNREVSPGDEVGVATAGRFVASGCAFVAGGVTGADLSAAPAVTGVLA